MKKLSKKQAEKLLEICFWDIDGDEHYLKSLCKIIPIEMYYEWSTYWNRINKSNLVLISELFDDKPEDKKTLASLTRLLTAHMFIEDTYK